MFNKVNSVKVNSFQAYTEMCNPLLKRINILKDKSILLLENTDETFYFRKILPDGKELDRIALKGINQYFSNYVYTEDCVYITCIELVGDYHEILNLYILKDNFIKKIFTTRKESYMHNLNYFNIFIEDEVCYLQLIRHNRLHLYKILHDNVLEIKVLEGQNWYLSNNYIICYIGKSIELYDPMLEVVGSFEYDEDIDWSIVNISAKEDYIVFATDNLFDESGGIYLYRKSDSDLKIHYQRYGFNSLGLCHGKVWATVKGKHQDLGGLMIFDEFMELKFAHIRNKNDGDLLKAYNPTPIVSFASDIIELKDNKVLLSANNKLIVTDIRCRILEEINITGIDCYNVSSQKDLLVELNIKNRVYSGSPENSYDCILNIYEWSGERLFGKVVDLISFRND